MWVQFVALRQDHPYDIFFFFSSPCCDMKHVTYMNVYKGSEWNARKAF